jgi:hypothetical protein
VGNTSYFGSYARGGRGVGFPAGLAYFLTFLSQASQSTALTLYLVPTPLAKVPSAEPVQPMQLFLLLE